MVERVKGIPEPHSKDLGEYLHDLYMEARDWKNQLRLPERWNENHQLVRGKHWLDKDGAADSSKIAVNLAGSNVIRTQANLTYKEPHTDCYGLDGADAENVDNEQVPKDEDKLGSKIHYWWRETEQQQKLSVSAWNGEVYAPMVEKHIAEKGKARPNCIPLDPHAVFFSPGNWSDIGDGPQCVMHLLQMDIDVIKQTYKLPAGTEISAEDVSDVLGLYRDDNRPHLRLDSTGSHMSKTLRIQDSDWTKSPGQGGGEPATERKTTPVWDCWLRDYRTESTTISLVDLMAGQVDAKASYSLDPETREPMVVLHADPFDPEVKYEAYKFENIKIQFAEDIQNYTIKGGIRVDYQKGNDDTGPSLRFTRLVYPGGIRNVVFANSGEVVLLDRPNPLINPNLPRWLTENTYGYDRFPFSKAESRKDPSSPWGYTDLENTAELNFQIDELVSRMLRFAKLCLWPPLIVPRSAGIKKEHLSNNDFKILRPASHQAASYIRFLDVPAGFFPYYFKVLEFLIMLFDRIYAIQDVDRGEVPYSGMAAASIKMLQEKNNVLIMDKIRAVDYLVRERCRWAISYWQNFGWQDEWLEVNDEMTSFRGLDLITRRFEVRVEPGSTYPLSDLHLQQMAPEWYGQGLISRKKAAELLKIPGWKEDIENIAEGQLGQAIGLLIEAGLPEDVGRSLYEQLQLQQHGASHGSRTPGSQTPGPQTQGPQAHGPQATGQGAPGGGGLRDFLAGAKNVGVG